MKTYHLAIIFIFAIMSVSFVSAGFFSDFYNKITGQATSDTTSLSIPVGNNAPTIGFVYGISAKNPTDDSTTSITFNFTATDADGFNDLNSSTASAHFQRSGETTRSNASCIQKGTGGNDANYSCTVDMWYYDENGAWTMNATIQDNQEAYVENTTRTFTYNLLPGMKINQTALTWSSVTIGQSNVGSNNDPIQINNTGNSNPVNINVTAYNLVGESVPSDIILAGNLSVDNVTQGCSGTQMVNGTAAAISTNVTNAILYKGNHSLNNNDETSGQELIFFCLTNVPSGISQQTYSSSAYGSWTVEII